MIKANRDRVEGLAPPRPTAPTGNVCLAADTPFYATHAVAVQHVSDLDADTIRDLNALRIARTHGLTLPAAALVAALAGLGPNDGGRR